MQYEINTTLMCVILVCSYTILFFELIILHQRKSYKYILLFGQWSKINMALLRAELMSKLRS
jgi:hypothetical protein